jgi:hypothetical protein
MDLDKMSSKLAILRRANRRATEQTKNLPKNEVLQHTSFYGGRKGKKNVDFKVEDMKDDDDLFGEGMDMEDMEDMKGGMMMGMKGSGYHSRKVGGAKRRLLGRKQMKKQDKIDKDDENMAMKARDLGKMYGKEIQDADPEVKDLVGGNFFSDFADGFMSVIKPAANIAKGILGSMPDPRAQAAAAGIHMLGGRKHKVVSAQDKRKKRGALISRLMKQNGMTLGQASRHIKEKGLM